MRMLTCYAVFRKVFCHRFHAVRNSISTGTPPSASPGVESWCSDFNDFNSYVWRKIAIFAPLSVAMSIPVAKTCGGETLIMLKNKKHGEGRRCGTEIILISFEKKRQNNYLNSPHNWKACYLKQMTRRSGVVTSSHKKKLLYTRAKRFLFAKLRAFILSYCHKLWNLISCENISIYQYATAWTLLEIRSTKPGQ